MVSTTSAPAHGRCTECGETHQLSASTRDAELGETFPQNYCCGNCLEEHGATEHVRVHHAQHAYEQTLQELQAAETEAVVEELLTPNTYSRALAAVQELQARGEDPREIWNDGRDSDYLRIFEETVQAGRVEPTQETGA